MRKAGRKQVIPQVADSTRHKQYFKGHEVPLKYKILYICNQKTIIGEDTIKPERYQARHMYYYHSWLEDDIAGFFKPDIKLKGRIIDKRQRHKSGIEGCPKGF